LLRAFIPESVDDGRPGRGAVADLRKIPLQSSGDRVTTARPGDFGELVVASTSCVCLVGRMGLGRHVWLPRDPVAPCPLVTGDIVHSPCRVRRPRAATAALRAMAMISSGSRTCGASWPGPRSRAALQWRRFGNAYASERRLRLGACAQRRDHVMAVGRSGRGSVARRRRSSSAIRVSSCSVRRPEPASC
jgi:hypothetical protein